MELIWLLFDRLSVEAELGALLEESKKLDEEIAKDEIIKNESSEEDIYCSVDEIRLNKPATDHINTQQLNINHNNNLNSLNNNVISIQSSKRDALQEISLNKVTIIFKSKLNCWFILLVVLLCRFFYLTINVETTLKTYHILTSNILFNCRIHHI